MGALKVPEEAFELLCTSRKKYCYREGLLLLKKCSNIKADSEAYGVNKSSFSVITFTIPFLLGGTLGEQVNINFYFWFHPDSWTLFEFLSSANPADLNLNKVATAVALMLAPVTLKVNSRQAVIHRGKLKPQKIIHGHIRNPI